MIRRNRKYVGIRYNDTVKYPPSQTSQDEPNLHEILVAYSRGQDVSQYLRKPASQATAEQQFTNRIGKVDYLTEMSDYVKQQVDKANKSVASDKSRSTTKKPTEKQEEQTQEQQQHLSE